MNEQDKRNPFGLGDQEGERKHSGRQMSSLDCERVGLARPPTKEPDQTEIALMCDKNFGIGYD